MTPVQKHYAAYLAKWRHFEFRLYVRHHGEAHRSAIEELRAAQALYIAHFGEAPDDEISDCIIVTEIPPNAFSSPRAPGCGWIKPGS